MIGIYCIENKIDHKKYIGQSVDIQKRWRHHKTTLRNGTHINTHLQRAWKKYGEENFLFYVVEEVGVEDLDRREIELIKELGTFKNGYNLTSGGEGQRERFLTEEEKKHLSEINMGEKNPNYGLKRSEKTKRRMSESMRGKKHGPHSEEWKRTVSSKLKGKEKPYFNKPVRWIETGKIFKSVTDASQATGYHFTSISAVCRGARKTIHKQHFEFMKETEK